MIKRLTNGTNTYISTKIHSHKSSSSSCPCPLLMEEEEVEPLEVIRDEDGNVTVGGVRIISIPHKTCSCQEAIMNGQSGCVHLDRLKDETLPPNVRVDSDPTIDPTPFMYIQLPQPSISTTIKIIKEREDGDVGEEEEESKRPVKGRRGHDGQRIPLDPMTQLLRGRRKTKREVDQDKPKSNQQNIPQYTLRSFKRSTLAKRVEGMAEKKEVSKRGPKPKTTRGGK